MKLRHYLVLSGVALIAAAPIVWAMSDPLPAFVILCLGGIMIGIAAILTPGEPQRDLYKADWAEDAKDRHEQVKDAKNWPPREKR